MATSEMTVDEILAQLTLREKVSLTSAESWWRTETILRGNKILVPHIKVSTGKWMKQLPREPES